MLWNDWAPNFPSIPSRNRGWPPKNWDQALTSFSCTFFLKEFAVGVLHAFLMCPLSWSGMLCPPSWVCLQVCLQCFLPPYLPCCLSRLVCVRLAGLVSQPSLSLVWFPSFFPVWYVLLCLSLGLSPSLSPVLSLSLSPSWSGMRCSWAAGGSFPAEYWPPKWINIWDTVCWEIAELHPVAFCKVWSVVITRLTLYKHSDDKICCTTCFPDSLMTVVPFNAIVLRSIRLEKIRSPASVPSMAVHQNAGATFWRCPRRNSSLKKGGRMLRMMRHCDPRVRPVMYILLPQIRTTYLQNPSPETPPSRITTISSPLSVPSRSRSLGRPSFSLCLCSGTTAPRSRTRRAAARVCREAGTRVTTNTRRMDFHLDDIQRQDDRRIEVIKRGPLPGRGVQLAIDTTLVSPLTRASKPRTRAGRYAGAPPAMCWPRVPPPPHRPPADSAPRPKEQCLELASSPCVSGAAYIHGTCHAHAQKLRTKTAQARPCARKRRQEKK